MTYGKDLKVGDHIYDPRIDISYGAIIKIIRDDIHGGVLLEFATNVKFLLNTRQLRVVDPNIVI